jgi:hypothetical protein
MILGHFQVLKGIFINSYQRLYYNDITNLLRFIGLYKFCVKFGFHGLVQKSHEFHVRLK